MIEIPKKEPLNIVPFIDIMLVLLAMVLSISTFIARGEIQISLPQSKTAATPQTGDAPSLVQVDAEGTFFLDGEPRTFADLERFVAEIPRERRVLLRIDRDSKFEHFIRVIDLLKANNHENFSIAAEKTER